MISNVLSKNGSLSEMLRYIGTTPHDAMKLLKGPFKFIEVVIIVMLLALILIANVATLSSPIWIEPCFLTASTSSMVKSRPLLLFDLVQQFFSWLLRSKQSLLFTVVEASLGTLAVYETLVVLAPMRSTLGVKLNEVQP